MTEGSETLSEKICTVECIIWTLSKGCDRLIDRLSLQEGNMLAIKLVQ